MAERHGSVRHLQFRNQGTWRGLPAGYERRRIAAARHTYCFAPCSGLVDACRDSTSLIWRTNLEPYHREAEFRFQASGLADWISSSRRAALSRMLG
jgi:hypothetical protein